MFHISSSGIKFIFGQKLIQNWTIFFFGFSPQAQHNIPVLNIFSLSAWYISLRDLLLLIIPCVLSSLRKTLHFSCTTDELNLCRSISLKENVLSTNRNQPSYPKPLKNISKIGISSHGNWPANVTVANDHGYQYMYDETVLICYILSLSLSVCQSVSVCLSVPLPFFLSVFPMLAAHCSPQVQLSLWTCTCLLSPLYIVFVVQPFSSTATPTVYGTQISVHGLRRCCWDNIWKHIDNG